MAGTLHVELVSADRLLWSGEATSLLARTLDGDIGILPGHAPVMSLLADGVVEIDTEDKETWVAAVDAGFLSVAMDRVSILAESAVMSHDIDLERAKNDLSRIKSAGVDDDEAAEEVRRLEARIRAVEMAS
ncbi:F0F1 ATP synthase subunit epsilon [Mumia sp. zg.B53]|uniref:F0F1 ATP synthase subunit epsilon n=1 Tax=unclassified Mumia TaxID=2621872 RepID=UPI001C6ED872|nr:MULTISPECIES: F0F1 ATP synthase subunit epsilon [unclassified Mumia]MBW9206590.1 F0F1 ATP synthase subunit epsilon [Mumia sp. zg.B17]MBW9211120.1 F0F1 ATP synthase subunit epsilon [Mumia sp. zg.B21]MBW9215688.1 F0F1 ATP synthase subunit epsilon [Mumia sp. zg.B53]MDD9347830.1 F0F1 ATP synthase subunit epsilon [Mumia sp.]